MPGNKRKTILLVDDEGEIVDLLAMLLEVEGFAVITARDGVEALAAYRANEERIGLVITDLGLPRLGGVDLIEKIRISNPSVKIIGASGYGGTRAMEEVKAVGGDEFVPKPYVTENLIALARRLLEL